MRLPATPQKRNTELLEQVQPGDLIRYGLIPEFVGRLPVAGVMNDLDKSALVRILTEPKNALLKQYQRLFEFENVRLRFTDDALETVAELALQRKVGARGLRMILEDLMLEVMYHLPDAAQSARLRGHRGHGAHSRNQLEFAGKGRIGCSALPKIGGFWPLEVKFRDPMFNREKQEMKRVPMMPVRDMVIFPQQMTPFIVGREASVRALEEALAGDKKIFLSTQHDASVDDPKPEEIYAVGTLANIVQSVKLPDGNIKVLVEGVERARALSIATEEGFFRATVRLLNARVEPSPQVEQTVQKITGLYEQFIKLSQSLNYDTMIAAARVDDPARLSDTIAANLQLPVDEKQDLLETVDPIERLNRIGDILEIELEKLNVDRNINTRVKRQMERAQKEYYLNEKLKAIQKELGRGEKSEIDELKKKIDAAGMSKEVHEKAIQELKRLELMPPMSAESTVSRNYLDWLLAVPWKKRSKEIRDILAAEKILNEEHYGLEKIKDRILEFLAVRQLVKNPKGSILCFVGPPGVGKTSLAMSIGHATGRKFVRVSLGGVRDEAEIRGHRRTYIGALPGQIIQMMKKAGTVNPIFVLDEVDKMSMDFRGDPSAALMEVLDPELNHAFTDHYLDVEYDLSKVMFVCTANVLHTIPQPLQDRMEVLRIPGYTEQEKLQIAKRFLVARQREATGLTDKNLTFTDEGLLHIIRHYTHEAGVRSLEREIQNVSRKMARKVVTEGPQCKCRNHAGQQQRLPRRPQIPRILAREAQRNRPDHRPGLDRSRRLRALDRSHLHGRQRPPNAHR